MYLHEDDSEQQVQAILGQAVLLPRGGPAPPSVGIQHAPPPAPLPL